MTARPQSSVAAVALLRELEWKGNAFGMRCPSCKSLKTEGHTPDCRLAAALSTTPRQEPAQTWRPISDAKEDPDLWLWVFAPGAEFDLPEIICPCRWHPDAGFCVDELRYPTLFIEMRVPPLPANPEQTS